MERTIPTSFSDNQQENNASSWTRTSLFYKKMSVSRPFKSSSKANTILKEEISTLKLSNEKLSDKCRKSEIEARRSTGDFKS